MATTRTTRKNLPQALDPAQPGLSTDDNGTRFQPTRKVSHAKSSKASTKPITTRATLDSKSSIPVPPSVRMASKELRGRLNPAAQVLAGRSKKSSSKSRSYPAPAPRPGRQFTVGSIGTNGLIYLRYVSDCIYVFGELTIQAPLLVLAANY